MSRFDWSTAPTVFVSATQCPKCGATRYTRSRTNNNGDGSVTKHCRCNACGERFKVCVETSPVSGIDVTWGS